MNILSIIFFQTLRSGAPLCITAAGATCSELTGVTNIGLEGMMLIGAFASAVISYYTGNPWIGLAAGMCAGGILAWLHGLISIRYQGNQIVSGVAINLFALGFTDFMLRVLFNQSGSSPQVAKLPSWGAVSPLLVIIYLLCIGTHFFVYKTKLGLRMRAVGEHPLAADTVGVNVARVRYFGVIISGVFAGMAGAYLSIATLSQFAKGMTAGRGFIALAAMIFGKWTPLGALGAGLLFGLFSALEVLGQQYLTAVPGQFIQMLPYILTILALAGVVGRAVAPAADGVPYTKSED